MRVQIDCPAANCVSSGIISIKPCRSRTSKESETIMLAHVEPAYFELCLLAFIGPVITPHHIIRENSAGCKSLHTRIKLSIELLRDGKTYARTDVLIVEEVIKCQTCIWIHVQT